MSADKMKAMGDAIDLVVELAHTFHFGPNELEKAKDIAKRLERLKET